MKGIDVRDLRERDVEPVEGLVRRLRAKANAEEGDRAGNSGFSRSAGPWKGFTGPDELIADLYWRRTVTRRRSHRAEPPRSDQGSP